MTPVLLVCMLGLTPPSWALDDTTDIVEEPGSVEMPESPLEPPPDAATAAARTERLQTNLRCPVCQGLSVSDSPSDAARAMGDRIEELVLEGYTEAQITTYFVDRYGAWVELEPPREDHQALFWAPVAAVAAGFIGIVVFGARRRDTKPEPALQYTPDPELGPWRDRIMNELDGNP